MRRPQVNPKSREKLLGCALELMRKRGYGATSVEDICRAARVTKGCFFHYFESKEQLGQMLLERFCCDAMSEMKDGCCTLEGEKDPLKRVFGRIDFFINMYRRQPDRKGCLIGKFTQELSEMNPEIRTMCAEGFAKWGDFLKKDLQAAKARYAAKSNIDARSLAEHFIAVVQGSQILARAKQDGRVVEQNLKHFKEYLRRLFKR